MMKYRYYEEEKMQDKNDNIWQTEKINGQGMTFGDTHGGFNYMTNYIDTWLQNDI